MPPSTRFRTRVPIRFSDLDAYGHVNNAVFFTYLEVARVQLFSGNFTGTFEGDAVFLVRSASCTYLRPIPFQPEVVVDVAIARLRGGSVDLTYELGDGESLVYATAATTLVSIDPSTGRPVRLPQWIRELDTAQE
ncbi:MAG: acyl-CoA thioesterase [Spirochaetota bacterium]